MFLKENFLQCLNRFTKSQQQQQQRHSDDDNIILPSSGRSDGGNEYGQVTYNSATQNVSFSGGGHNNNNNNNSTIINSRVNGNSTTFIKRRTAVLFSTNRGLHIRVAKLGLMSSNSNHHLNTSSVITAHSESLRGDSSSLPLNNLETYNINFCDLERWSTNRAHTVNLEDTFTVLPRINALQQQQQLLSLEQLPITRQTSLSTSSLAEHNLALQSACLQNGKDCKIFSTFKSNNSLNSLHNGNNLSINEQFKQSKRRSVHFHNNHNITRF